MSAPIAVRARLWVFFLPALFLLAWMALGPKPWSDGVAAAKAKGRDPKPAQYAVTGTWYGSALALPAALVLIFLRRRATAPLPANLAPPPESEASLTERWLPRLALLTVLGATGASQFHRLDQSLWDDEEKAMRFFTVGRCAVNEDGQVKLARTTWTDVFFNYRQPNNHIFFSLLSKASHDLLAPPPDTPGRPYFSERALRLPAFAGGLLALAGTAWMVAALGYRRVGWAAAAVLALHPWFLRYLVEARGYSWVLAAGAFAIGFAARALTDGRLRWWTGLAASFFIVLHTYPGAVYFVAWCQAAIFLALWNHPGGAEARRALWPRWLAALVWCAIPLVVLYAPCVPQMLEYLAAHREREPVTGKTWLDLASLLFCGSTARSWDPGNPLSLGLADILNAGWINRTLAAVLLIGLAGGVFRLALGGPVRAFLLLAMILPAVSFPLHAMLGGKPFYPWYAIGALPFVAALAVLGVSWIAPRSGLRTCLGVFLVVFSFAFLTNPQRSRTCQHPVECKRECVLTTRGPEINPFRQSAEAPVTLSFHQENRAYDPHQLVLDDPDHPEAFEAALEKAAASGRRVFVEFGQESLARVHFPRIFQHLDDPSQFRQVAVFPGMEPQNTRKVMEFVQKKNAGAE